MASAGGLASLRRDAEIAPGEPVWIGVDVGGSRSATSAVMVTEDLRVQAKVWQGDSAVLDVAAHLRQLARDYSGREVAFDPWRFRSEALRLEEEGLPMSEFPQSTARMVPASEQLYSAIVERKLTHGNDPELNRHVAGAVAKQTPRGWRLDKSERAAQIDAVVALAMALERADQPAEAPRLLGFI